MGIWIPEEYGGHGAGVLDMCVVVEELSRACGGIGVAYAVNALGSFPIMLGGTEEQKRRCLPAMAERREADRLRALGEGVGLRRRLAARPRGAGRRRLRHQRRQEVEHQRRRGVASTPSTPPPTRSAAPAASRRSSSRRARRGSRSASARTPWGSAACRCTSSTSATAACRPPQLLGGKEGAGFANAMMTLDRARPGVAAQARRPRPGGVRVGGPLHLGAAAVRPERDVVPGDPVHARRHGDPDRGGAPARLHRGARHRRRAARTRRSSPRCAR